MLDLYNLPEVGTQIVYVPHHAAGFLTHPDCEYGFITSYGGNGSIAFCRYWRKNITSLEWLAISSDPSLDNLVAWEEMLRTKASSEATPIENLIVIPDMAPQQIVDELVRKYTRQLHHTSEPVTV